MKAKTIYVRLTKEGREVLSTIIIKDGVTISTFSNQELAKQVFDYDKANGEDVAYSIEKNAYIKFYKEKEMEEIVEELKKQIEIAGGQLIK